MPEPQYAHGLLDDMEAAEEEAQLAGTNVFASELGAADDAEADQTQEEVDQDAQKYMHQMVTRKGETIGGIKLRPFTFSSLALLVEANSVYVTFTSQLTPQKKKRLQALAKKAQSNAKMRKAEMEELGKLMALMQGDAQNLGNLFMEVLKFLAVMDAGLTFEEAQEMVFEGGEGAVRAHGLKIGDRLQMTDLDALSDAIGDMIARHTQSRVQAHETKKTKEEDEEVGN